MLIPDRNSSLTRTSTTPTLVSFVRFTLGVLYQADNPLASLEVKSKAPNGVTFNVKGKSAHEGPIAGSVSCFGSAEEGKGGVI